MHKLTQSVLAAVAVVSLVAGAAQMGSIGDLNVKGQAGITSGSASFQINNQTYPYLNNDIVSTLPSSSARLTLPNGWVYVGTDTVGDIAFQNGKDVMNLTKGHLCFYFKKDAVLTFLGKGTPPPLPKDILKGVEQLPNGDYLVKADAVEGAYGLVDDQYKVKEGDCDAIIAAWYGGAVPPGVIVFGGAVGGSILYGILRDRDDSTPIHGQRP